MVFSFRHRWVFTIGESRVDLFFPRRAIGPKKKAVKRLIRHGLLKQKNRGV
jgi:hypothetical protein